MLYKLIQWSCDSFERNSSWGQCLIFVLNPRRLLPSDSFWVFSHKLTGLQFSMYFESPPNSFYHNLHSFWEHPWAWLSIRLGKTLKTIFFNGLLLTPFPNPILQQNIWFRTLESGDGNNGRLLSEWYPHSRSWVVGGSRAARRPLSLHLLTWNHPLTSQGKNDGDSPFSITQCPK